tara:strand:- start:369 stop:527 length:159 start_codon:yes stop_codon:yes gene_type:complete
MELKKPRTIRWDGTCKKCGVKSYFAPVRIEGKSILYRRLMCILCYWRAKKDV